MNNLRTLQTYLRCDLNDFVQKTTQTIDQSTPFLPNWHIEAIIHHLNLCGDGKIDRLIITQPPRSLKSICVSVAFPAWMLGHDPRRKFTCVSYSNEFATELARQFRVVIESNWYKELFPGMRAAKDTALDLVTTKGGGRFGTSIGGTLTGRGSRFIIIDDPLKAEDAQSKSARDRVNKWFGDTLFSRLDDKRDGVIIAVMQRLHEEDLAGYLLEQGGWHHLDLPAIAVDDQDIPINPIENHLRKAGDVLHPEREPLEVLEKIKAAVGSLTFSAQYQQRPVPLEGNLVKRSWFGTYEAMPDRGRGVRTVQSWDVASTISEHSDWSVCTTWLVKGNDYFLKHVLRARLEYPELKRRIISIAEQHGADTILIEDAGAGKHLIQDLRQATTAAVPRPIGIRPEADKVTRMEAQSAKIEAGQVFLPRDAPWLDDFLAELLAFPNGKHDDQVDSLSQFLGWVSKPRRQELIGLAPEVIYAPD